MTLPLLRTILSLALAAVLTPGCSSLEEHVARAREANDALVESGAWPEGSTWVVVAEGEAAGAQDDEKAYEVHADAVQRYVFRPGEAGDVRPRMAYLPTAPIVAGRGFAESLGLTLRRDASGATVLGRDVRRVRAAPGEKILVRIATPDGRFESPAAVLLDPDFHGPLLVSRAIAEELGLRRFEIPGEARMDVALGRPFRARRARVRIVVDELGVSETVEVLSPR